MPTKLLFPRLLKKIDHPERDQIPLLSMTPPESWPESLRTEWRWTGACANTTPVIRTHSGTVSVLRLLFHHLIRRLEPGERVFNVGSPRNVNPMYADPRLVADVLNLPGETDINDLAHLLTLINPQTTTDITPLLAYYTQNELFEGLVRANLLDQTGITSPAAIHRK